MNAAMSISTMYKRAVSQQAQLQASPMPYFFISTIFGEPGTWPTYFNFLDRIGSGPPNDDPKNIASWRRKFKRLYARTDPDRDHKSITLGYYRSDSFRRRIESGEFNDRGPMTSWWLVFEEFVNDIEQQYSDSPITHFLIFLTNLHDCEFDSELTAMLMLCAYIEWINLDQIIAKGESVYGLSRCETYFVPIDTWIPQSDGNRLRTTRNRILTELLSSRDDRNYRHLIGEPQWYSDSTDYRKLSVKSALLELKRETNAKPLAIDDHQYRILFTFVKFFEWMQLDMLSNNIPASRIELSFSRLPELASELNDKIYKYFIDNNV